MRGFLLAFLTTSALLLPASAYADTPALPPLDAQSPSWADDTTWSDYKPLPGRDYSDPTIQPSVKKWRVALVMTDFPDREFAITQPQGSTIYGNPTAEAHDIPRAQVPAFYRDFLNTPSALNHFQTMNRYWMEDTYGKYGVELVPFGVYRMPFRAYQYFQSQYGRASECPTPTATPCNKNFRTDARAAWVAEVGLTVVNGFDNIFYVAAGQDQSSTWQEFGEMRFLDRDKVTDPFGPKSIDPTMANNWGTTRYVPWTAWAATTNIWPNAVTSGAPPLNSIEGESSGMSTYAHELTHNLGILDNYNNPYNVPPQRSGTGNWDMMSRGTFNGPGGPHTRYLIPPSLGAALGSQHNVRNKLKLGFVEPKHVLQLNRNGLAQSGLAVADVTAREWEPGSGLAGVRVTLDGTAGDNSAPCDFNTNPLCDGVRRQGTTITGKYNHYLLEVVQQIGSDSFAPGHGVLLSKVKNTEGQSCGTFACFVWMIDANPQDIDRVDFVRPDGTPAKVTIGDPRQLNDAAFNAGLDSGSQYEWEDAANRLHFYVVNLRKDANGILHYTIAVRSLDGAGPQTRGAALASAPATAVSEGTWSTCTFTLRNTGAAAGTPAGLHPQDANAWLTSDVYRLSASTSATGWTAKLQNALAAVKFGETAQVPVFVSRAAGASASGQVTLTARSESDPSKTATAVCGVADGGAGGTVAATLSLAMGTPATFGAFLPGFGRDYTATTGVTVTSTAGDATLSIADPSTTATGHLVNGAFSLAQPLQAQARSGTFAPIGSSSNPASLLSWDGPVSNDQVPVAFKQSVSATEPLRTGTYSKTLTFTLSTTNP